MMEVRALAHKYSVLHARRGLITDGFFARTRNPNYLGEMVLYASFAILAGHWLPSVILARVWLYLFLFLFLSCACRTCCARTTACRAIRNGRTTGHGPASSCRSFSAGHRPICTAERR